MWLLIYTLFALSIHLTTADDSVRLRDRFTVSNTCEGREEDLNTMVNDAITLTEKAMEALDAALAASPEEYPQMGYPVDREPWIYKTIFALHMLHGFRDLGNWRETGYDEDEISDILSIKGKY